jgi:hypothetical protein
MFFRFYTSALAKRPVLTQSLTASTLFMAGDLLAQVGPDIFNFQRFEQAKELNYTRALRKGVFGLCVAGPAMVHWYRLLNRIQDPINPVRALCK